jgi:tetratricopeptide (TPR) repeat protein
VIGSLNNRWLIHRYVKSLGDIGGRLDPTNLGLGQMMVSARQIRRWESASPPWPRADHQRLLVHVLHLPVDQLGFTPPWEVASSGPAAAAAAHEISLNASTAALPVPTSDGMIQPATVASDYAAITAAYRRLYASVQPAHLHSAVAEHTRMGAHLLTETAGVSRQILAAALAESLLLAGRIEFFDLQRPEEADRTYVQALQTAGEANDPLLGSAILAHVAFIPGWVKDGERAAERIRAARVYARRGPASTEFLAWLDAVEAECETISGNTHDALRLINHAETVLAGPSDHQSSDWLTWFSPIRLAAFKGNTQLKAGHLPQARETLTAALEEALPSDDKQRTVILGDLAAVEAANGHPEAACQYAEQALDQLSRTWYATGMDRVIEVRKALQQFADRDCVQRLDDRLYGWQTTLSALRH